ncbi:MAG: hypothetical protein QM804_06290 [Propionicimonas sp.]
MKRLGIALLATCWLLLGAPHATAADLTDYTVEAANLKISVPTDLAVVTRDGIQSHAAELEELGLDLPGLLQLLQSSGGYLNAFATDASYEYMVIVIEPQTAQRVWNFGKLSDDLLKTMSAEIIKEVEKNGYQASLEEIHRVGDVAYLVMSGAATAGGDDYRHYYTIVNGRMTSITMHSYVGPISDELTAEHRAVVDSTTFLSVVPDPNPEADPSTLPDRVQSIVTWVVVGGGVVLLGIIVLIVVLVRRSGKRKAAAALAAPVGPPVGYPPTSTPPPPPGDQQPPAPTGPTSG